MADTPTFTRQELFNLQLAVSARIREVEELLRNAIKDIPHTRLHQRNLDELQALALKVRDLHYISHG